MKPRLQETEIVAGQFSRLDSGISWRPPDGLRDLPLTGQAAWQSNGGPTRTHPARSLPFSFEIKLAEKSGSLVRIHLIGIFALYADKNSESFGTLGASV